MLPRGGEQMRHGPLGNMEQAAEIDRENPVPRLVREIGQVVPVEHAGDVEQDVELAQRRHRIVHHRTAGRRDRGVEFDRSRGHAVRLGDFRRDGAGALDVDVGQRQRRALGAQLAGACPADSRRCAGDEGGFCREAHGLSRSVFRTPPGRPGD